MWGDNVALYCINNQIYFESYYLVWLRGIQNKPHCWIKAFKLLETDVIDVDVMQQRCKTRIVPFSLMCIKMWD